MSDFDDLDSLLGPLREPATAAELASERAMIDLMTTSHRHAKGNIMFSSRRARVATLIAAGVIGFGGVAAAGGGGLDLDNLAPQEVEEEVEEVEVEEIEVEEIEETEVEEIEEIEEITTTTAAAVVEDDSDVDTFSDEIAKATLAAVAVEEAEEEGEVEIVCAEGNHGKTVSAVAHGDDPQYDGVEVRDAAHSDCGKTDDDTAVDDDEVSDDDDDSDEDSVESDDDNDSDDDDIEDDVDDDDSDEGAGRESKGDRGNGHANGGNGNHGKSGNDD